MTILWNQHLAVVVTSDSLILTYLFQPCLQRCTVTVRQARTSDHTSQHIWVDYYQFHCPRFSFHGFVACQVSFS